MHLDLPRAGRRAAACLAALAALAACDSSSESLPRVGAALQEVSGNDQSAAAGARVANPVVVRVVDDRGRPVEGELVVFRVVSGGGTLAAGTAQSDEAGEARDLWTLGTSSAAADSQRVEARLSLNSGGQAATVTFRATARPGAVTDFVVLSGGAQEGSAGAALPAPVVGRAIDQFGNPVPGATVTWTVRSGGGQITPTSTTDAAGNTSAAWVLGGEVNVPQRAAATVGSAPAAEVVAFAGVTQGTVVTRLSGNQQTGPASTQLPQPLVVRVLHANGTPVVGVPVTWTVSQGGGYVAASSLTNAQGEASTAWAFATTLGTHSVAARISSGVGVVFTGTATAGAPAGIEKAIGDVSGTVGMPVTLAARVRDIGGNPVPGVTVTWATSSGGSFQPASSVTDAQGIARTQWTLPTTSGSHTATASTGNLTTAPFGVFAAPGPVTTLATVPGSVTVSVGQSATAQVVARDRYGNEVLARFVSGVVENSAIAQAFADSEPRGRSTLFFITGRSPGQTTLTISYQQTGSPQVTATVPITVR